MECITQVIPNPEANKYIYIYYDIIATIACE